MIINIVELRQRTDFLVRIRMTWSFIFNNNFLPVDGVIFVSL